MGVFTARRLLSVLFAFAPLPHYCAPAILSCGRSGGLARSFQPCFLHEKAGKHWFIDAAGADSDITLYCP